MCLANRPRPPLSSLCPCDGVLLLGGEGSGGAAEAGNSAPSSGRNQCTGKGFFEGQLLVCFFLAMPGKTGNQSLLDGHVFSLSVLQVTTNSTHK